MSDDSKRWIGALFYYLNDLAEMDALTRVGSKLPSDDPDNPNQPLPHVDLVPLPGLGFDEYRITAHPDDFMFTLRRRPGGSGSWIDIMKFDGNQSPVQWKFGATFLPLETNAYDFGEANLRWRDLFIYRYLNFYGFASGLPTPGTLIANAITTRRPISGAYGLDYCKKRNAGDFKWCEISDMQMTIAILKSVNGIVRTDIGAIDVEILGAAHRVKVDLSYMDRCRVVFGGVNSAAVTFYCKIQYSTDDRIWYDLTPEGASDGTANEQMVAGSWGDVPTGALTDVFVRAVGRVGAESDPTYKSIELQVR